MTKLWSRGVVVLLLIIGLVGGSPLGVQAKGGGEVSEAWERLVALRILPEDVEPDGLVTYEEFVRLGERLMRGWKDDGLTYELGITVPEGLLMSYQEALKIAGMYLGYMEAEGIPKMKQLTPELNGKAVDDPISGGEMAYIFAAILESRHRVGQGTVLEERYLAGLEERFSSRIMRITSSEIELEDEGKVPLADRRQAYRIVGGQLVEIPFRDLFVGMEGGVGGVQKFIYLILKI